MQSPQALDAVEPAGSADEAACAGAAGIDEDLGWALVMISRCFRDRAGEALAELPGGPRGYLVLTSIATGPPRSQLALAQQLGVDKTVMTYLLDALEAAGYVTRRPDPADRRARRVAITKNGSASLADFRTRLADAEDSVLAALTDLERKHLRELLGRVARSAQSIGSATCPTEQDTSCPG